MVCDFKRRCFRLNQAEDRDNHMRSSSTSKVEVIFRYRNLYVYSTFTLYTVDSNRSSANTIRLNNGKTEKCVWNQSGHKDCPLILLNFVFSLRPPCFHLRTQPLNLPNFNYKTHLITVSILRPARQGSGSSLPFLSVPRCCPRQMMV